MTIEFEIENKKKLIKFSGEYAGIFIWRNEILRKKKGKAKKYNRNKMNIEVTIVLLILWLLTIGIFINDIMAIEPLALLGRRSTLFAIITTIILIRWILQLKKTYKELLKILYQKGTLTITSDKITCNFNDREISTPLEKTIGVIIGKHSLNIITNNNTVFNVPIDIKDKVISALNKYKSDILIIKLK